MPIITPLRPLEFNLRDGELEVFGTGRAPGLHMSDIVKAQMEAAGEKVGSIEGEDPKTRPQTGFWWEHAMQLAMMQHLEADLTGDSCRIVWQPRLVKDNIHISPDGFCVKHNHFVSVKLTWKSMRKWEEDAERYFWPWFQHDMAAMWTENSQTKKVFMLRTDPDTPVTMIRYFHFWINGDYTRQPGRGAQTTYSDVTFSLQEQANAWATTKRYQDWLLAERSAKSE